MIRKNSSNMAESETKNEVKKMRVEQVVTALYKGENVSVKHDENMNVMTSPVYAAPSLPEPTYTHPSRNNSSHNNNTNSEQPKSPQYEKQTVNVIPNHPPPLLLRPQAVIPGAYPQPLPFFPVPRGRGIHFNSDKSKITPIMKVPRDSKFPFNIYDPKATSQNLKENGSRKGKPYSSVKPYKKTSVSKATTNQHEHKLNGNSNQFEYERNKNQSPITQNNHLPATNNVASASVTQGDNLISKKKLDKWSVEEVYNFLKTSECSQYADIFLEQEIDGEALELLDETNISRCLGVKMGPAIKLNCTIQKLRKSYSEEN